MKMRQKRRKNYIFRLIINSKFWKNYYKLAFIASETVTLLHKLNS